MTKNSMNDNEKNTEELIKKINSSYRKLIF